MYILVYCENTDAGDPIDSVNIRCFSKKENARRAMEDAYQKTDAIMHYSDMGENDEHYVERSEDSITVHDGMDSLRWEIMEVKPEDAGNDIPAANGSDATMLVLYHIGHDSWNRPVYVSNGTLYVDTDPARTGSRGFSPSTRTGLTANRIVRFPRTSMFSSIRPAKLGIDKTAGGQTHENRIYAFFRRDGKSKADLLLILYARVYAISRRL